MVSPASRSFVAAVPLSECTIAIEGAGCSSKPAVFVSASHDTGMVELELGMLVIVGFRERDADFDREDWLRGRI